jgi:hypothetical protein
MTAADLPDDGLQSSRAGGPYGAISNRESDPKDAISLAPWPDSQRLT